MKKLFIAFFAITMLASCGKDEKSCTQDEFVGSYTGTRDCALGMVEDYSTNFTAGANDNEILWTLNNTEYTLKISGCKAKYSDTFLGVGVNISFERMDDGTITGTHTETVSSAACTVEMAK